MGIGLKASTTLYIYSGILALTSIINGSKNLEQLVDKDLFKLKNIVSISVKSNDNYFSNLTKVYNHPDFLKVVFTYVSKTFDLKDISFYLSLSSVYAFGLGYYFRREEKEKNAEDGI